MAPWDTFGGPKLAPQKVPPPSAGEPGPKDQNPLLGHRSTRGGTSFGAQNLTPLFGEKVFQKSIFWTTRNVAGQGFLRHEQSLPAEASRGEKGHPDQHGRDSYTAVIPCSTRHHRGSFQANARTRCRHRKTCHDRQAWHNYTRGLHRRSSRDPGQATTGVHCEQEAGPTLCAG